MLARGVADFVTPADPAGPFAGVSDVITAHDLAIANLECVIAASGVAEPKAYTFLAPPLAAEGLAGAGFDLVSLANNHAMDYGAAATLESIAHLVAADVATVGAGADDVAAAAPVFLESHGLQFAFLAFNDVSVEPGNGGWTAGPGKPGMTWWDPFLSPAAIAAAKAQADVVVVQVHFGQEYAPSPSGRQREIARAAIDAGATIVAGTHPHVLQEVEEYGGGLIAYSLGNFVFDGFAGEANRSAILSVTLGPAGIEGWEIIPVSISWSGLPSVAP